VSSRSANIFTMDCVSFSGVLPGSNRMCSPVQSHILSRHHYRPSPEARGQSQLTASALRIIDQIHQRYILVLCHVPDKQASVAALGPKDSVARFLLEVRFVNDVRAVSLFARIPTSVSSCQLFDPSNEELTVLLSPTRRNFMTSFVSFTRPNFPLGFAGLGAEGHCPLLFCHKSTAEQHLPTRCYKCLSSDDPSSPRACAVASSSF
jgi:hypothetical protein